MTDKINPNAAPGTAQHILTWTRAWETASRAVETAEEHRDELAYAIEQRAREVFDAKQILIQGGSLRFKGMTDYDNIGKGYADHYGIPPGTVLLAFEFYDGYDDESYGTNHLTVEEMTSSDLAAVAKNAKAAQRAKDRRRLLANRAGIDRQLKELDES